ncbi:uncharacterized protein STEHIDRAFT_124451 [Stereum hirsutum FP-91666 SS1]|uniref:uncharacterized protein n=1 Tax=Stereum hirsutum (strain FP-91666) TaxID=721885 RepID=UPI000444A873|nr:uncharacterized protein STEHIDRAFT_124451 [Stereum hirsutum FP-91666 SS1]EIM82269.1 hypothetical protein STEHIDRAFT_124451 [Stereum hirsutum FP-91666 SS1]
MALSDEQEWNTTWTAVRESVHSRIDREEREGREVRNSPKERRICSLLSRISRRNNSDTFVRLLQIAQSSTMSTPQSPRRSVCTYEAKWGDRESKVLRRPGRTREFAIIISRNISAWDRGLRAFATRETMDRK